MKLVPVAIDSILIGQPLPCALRDQTGVLLANKGFQVGSRADLENMVGRRSEIYIDFDQTDNFRRGYINRLNNLVLEDRELGQIAQVQISPYDATRATVDVEVSDHPDWFGLQTEANTVLLDDQADTFVPRLQRLQSELEKHMLHSPDATLFALIQLASNEIRHYSATHAMLVCVICSLTARDVLHWRDNECASLASAALTMNMSMTDLQDQLVVQKKPISPAQLKLLDSHAARSVDRLQQMGITDPLWLEAVLRHNATEPGPLATRPVGERLARLIQRADKFAAQLAPRSARNPVLPGTAMQACYFDEIHQIDEAGSALIKAVGIYSPGTYVRLTTQEIGVVVNRGRNTTMPRVAVLVNRQGMPTGEPILRDTSLAEFRILSSVSFSDVKITHRLDRLLTLTRQVGNDRPW